MTKQSVEHTNAVSTALLPWAITAININELEATHLHGETASHY